MGKLNVNYKCWIPAFLSSFPSFICYQMCWLSLPTFFFSHVFRCKSRGHFVVFLSLFFPNTDLLKGVGWEDIRSAIRSSLVSLYKMVYYTYSHFEEYCIQCSELCVCVYVCYTRRTSDERDVGWPSGRVGDGVEGTNKRAAAAPGAASARGRDITGGPCMADPLKI